MGQARSATEYGPLVDRADWSYVDTGAAAPDTKAQKRRSRRQVSTLVSLRWKGGFYFISYFLPMPTK